MKRLFTQLVRGGSQLEIFDNLIMDLEYRFDYLRNKLFPYWDLNQEWQVTNNHKMIKEIED